jgi:hypothetical protein
MSSHEFFRVISPHFASLPKNITKLQINLDFASTDPVTVTAEFFCDIAENGDIISEKQETAVFELVRKE